MAGSNPDAEAGHSADSVIRAAEDANQRRATITLSANDSLAVAMALLHPSPAGPRLHRVAERYKTFMNQSTGER